MSESGQKLHAAEPLVAEVVRRGPPRYYHLLWDEDLEMMRPLFEALIEHRQAVVAYWYQLYALHFADERTLSEQEFSRLFEPALLRNKTALLHGDMDRYAKEVRVLGEELVRKNVPLQEIIASMHLFEQAAMAFCPESLKSRVDIATKFDQLSHIRVILLVDTYCRLGNALTRARLTGLERELNSLAGTRRQNFHGLVGSSRVMQRLYEQIEAVAATSGTVLIVGESGTGKELVARAIHECSPRHSGPFVPFNCAAIPKDLVESELFGYRRGAFSGANTEYLGLFRAADGGTLFLDEITEMSIEAQSKLLRVLQEYAVRPIGSTKEIRVDVRLIASTNREPEQAMEEGRLRHDLYYRLTAGELRVPPLRERIDDIPQLVDHFIALFNEKLRRRPPVEGIQPAALEALMRYHWPGNVRELANTIEAAITFGRGATIVLDDLPPRITRMPSPVEDLPKVSCAATFAEVERELIARALEQTNGNKVQAAKLLGISRKKLYAKIKKYGLACGPNDEADTQDEQ